MTDALSFLARRNPTASAENANFPVWGGRAGQMTIKSLKSGLIAAGYGFHVTVGDGTTPVVGGGNGTILDITEPEVIISVPSGAGALITSVRVSCELPADQDADVQEILMAVQRAAAVTANGTSTVETPMNLRTDNSRTSVCTVLSAVTADATYTGAITTPVLHMEVARKQLVTNIVTSGITQGILELVYEPKVPLVLVGPATFFVYFGGTQAMSGFAEATWIEMPEALNALFGGS